jgi:hypothetical protein
VKFLAAVWIDEIAALAVGAVSAPCTAVTSALKDVVMGSMFALETCWADVFTLLKSVFT